MPVFTPIEHHVVLELMIQIAVLLAVARLCGEIALRFNQPAVVGEILAGIVLGPSFLSTLIPEFGNWILPGSEGEAHLLEVISLIGAMFLLLITGLETDLTLIRRHARTAVSASIGGIFFTFISGYLFGQYLPDSLLTDPNQRLIFALFIATSMVISSIPVIAKVLIDLNLMRRDISQTVLAAGMSDDTLGWILLSLLAGLVMSGGWSTSSALRSLVEVAVYIMISFTLGRWLVKWSLDYVQDEIISSDRILTLVIVLTFSWAAVSAALGLEAVLGAFVMGILFRQMPRMPRQIPHFVESIALGIFAPIFFAVAGLKVNLIEIFTSAQLTTIALLFILIATAGKVAGTYLGARLIGKRGHWTALSFGAGLNARGAMGIIVATIGLDLGILTQEMFSIVFLMAMVTSVISPIALRWVLERVPLKEEERARLRQEELAAGSVIANVHRVLLPVRGPRNLIEAGHLVDTLAARTDLSVTLLHVTDSKQENNPSGVLDKASEYFHSVELVKKVVTNDDPARAILTEMQKDYDLLLLGAPAERENSQVLFTPMIDYLMRASPCTTIVVQGAPSKGHWPPHRILVPTNGSAAARHAAEFAYYLAPVDFHEVTILNVVEESDHQLLYDYRDITAERQLGAAHRIVEELRDLGEAREIHVNADVRMGPDPETVVLALAERENIDLIILGTDLRAGTDHLFLGPTVERILTASPCPVIVLNHK